MGPWSGHLAAHRYQMSDKFEYFAVRNAAGVFDSSPLYKYRIHGRGAERFLAGTLARDIQTMRSERTRSTPRGAMTAGTSSKTARHPPPARLGRVPADRRRAQPRALRPKVIGRRDGCRVERGESATTTASSPSRVHARASCSRRSSRTSPASPSSGLTTGTIADSPVTNLADRLQRRPQHHEVWSSKRGRQSRSGDTLWHRCRGVRWSCVFRLDALEMLRIEAGLLLLDVDFASSRFGWTDEDRSSLIELGWGWMVRDLAADDRAFIGRRAIEREIAEASSLAAGLASAGPASSRIHAGRPASSRRRMTPITGRDVRRETRTTPRSAATSYIQPARCCGCTSLAQVRPALAAPGSPVRLEIDVNHRYEYVAARTARLPSTFGRERRPDMPKILPTRRAPVRLFSPSRARVDRTC